MASKDTPNDTSHDAPNDALNEDTIGEWKTWMFRTGGMSYPYTLGDAFFFSKLKVCPSS